MTNGFLPYGSDDASVVFADPLTSPLTAAPTGWTNLKVGSAALTWTTYPTLPTGDHVPTHDSVLGMKAVSSVDGTTEVGYQLAGQTGGTLDPLDRCGQLTVEVETDWLYSYDANYAPDGYQPAGLEAILACIPSAGGARDIIVRGTDGQMTFRPFASSASAQNDFRNFNQTGTNPGKARIDRFGKDRFCTVQLAWNNSFGIFAINGSVLGYTTDRDYATELLTQFYIGNRKGVANTYVTGYYMRNLQLSTKFPNFGIIPDREIAVLSDSMFTDAQAAAYSGGGDNGPRFLMDKYFTERGCRVQMTVSSNDGYDVDSAQSPGSLHDVVNDVTNTSAKICILQGCTNDAGAQTASATVESEYKDLVEKIMGVNGNDATTIENIVCIFPPPRFVSEGNRAIEDVLISYRSWFLTLADWWDAAYPLQAGALSVYDHWLAMGGDLNPIADDLYKDQVLGNGDIHHAPHGYYLYTTNLLSHMQKKGLL